MAIAALAAIMVIWSFWQRDARPRAAFGFLAGLACLTYLVLQNGDLGSRMVYLEGAAVKPMMPEASGHVPRTGHDHDQQEESHEHHH
jgi:uncharacterized membrane protein